MPINFDELLSQGNDAADLVIQNRSEINAVFENLRSSLSRFFAFEIRFVEEPEYEDENKTPMSRISLMMTHPRKLTGYNHVYIESEEAGIRRKLTSIKRSPEGYPVTIVNAKNHYVAEIQEEFAAALGCVVSNPQTHLMFRNFKKNVHKILDSRTDETID
ncbi:hypothetical protein GLP37_06150 [Photobacterium phosphoreum]|uniref:hypothetical protein n=1 Tax=Photobacterium phosphoreum TaxID=659 RepID=UPI001E58133E|nr:hypothetical protein [Photobacterium phosphoreum]MCD9501754.1 hypothetical protein [Photobacterium phosphoreum]